MACASDPRARPMRGGGPFAFRHRPGAVVKVIGFHASHELYPPDELLRLMRRAEQVGFGAGMCSDHFHPWTPGQGQSGYSFAWLGAALQATAFPIGTVCCPVFRYHPAVVA